MTSGNISRLHRIIGSDEVCHYYLGRSVTVVELDPETGAAKSTIVGNNILAGEVVQYVVKAGIWFGSYPNTPDSSNVNSDGTVGHQGHFDKPSSMSECDFSFVGCTVSPGFEFSAFELGSCAKLIAEYSLAVDDVIKKLTVGLP